MDSLQFGCDGFAVGIDQGGAALTHDGTAQPLALRGPSSYSRHLPVHPVETEVPGLLQIAGSPSWRVPGRHAERPVMSRLLLGVDAPPLRRRSDEHMVAFRAHDFCIAGKMGCAAPDRNPEAAGTPSGKMSPPGFSLRFRRRKNRLLVLWDYRGLGFCKRVLLPGAIRT